MLHVALCLSLYMLIPRMTGATHTEVGRRRLGWAASAQISGWKTRPGRHLHSTLQPRTKRAACILAASIDVDTCRASERDLVCFIDQAPALPPPFAIRSAPDGTDRAVPHVNSEETATRTGIAQRCPARTESLPSADLAIQNSCQRRKVDRGLYTSGSARACTVCTTAGV